MANNVKARLVPKNENLIDWRKSGYVPKLGEILTATKSSDDSKSYIIVGDGITNTQQLPAIGVADHLIPQFFSISEIKEYRNSDIDFIGFLSYQQAIHVGEQPNEVFGLFYCGKDSIESDDSTKYIHFYNKDLTFKIDDITYDESSSKYIATEIIKNKTFSKNIIFSKIDSLERLIKSIEGGISFIGVSTTDPSTGTVIVNGVTITPEKGDIVYYNSIEFIYDGSSWVELGDPSGLQKQIEDLASSVNINKTNIETINNNITNINQEITTLEEKIDNVDFNIEYGDVLPTTGEEGDIYLLNSTESGEGGGLDIVDEEGYVQYINYDAEGNIILEDGQTYYYIDGTGSNKTYKEFTYTTGATLPVYEDTDYLLGNTVNVYFIKRLIPTVQIKNDINVNIHNINELKGINFADTGAEADDGKYGPYDPLDRDIYVRGGTLQSTKNWDFNGRYIGHIHYNENDFKPGELIDRNDYVASTGLLKDYRVNPFNYSTVSMFPSIAIIGDSWSCGSIYFGDTDIDGSYNSISWPTILCAKNGIKLFNYSASGMEANTFVSGKYANASLNKAISDCDTYSPDLYVVALGYNEQNGAGTPGTEDESFCGSLTTIYNQLSAKNPNAKWIIIKQPTTQSNPTLPTGISEGCASIANYIGCPYIDSDEDKFFLTDFYKNNLFTDNVSNHPIAATYAGIANAYDRLISKCIVDNVDYFKYFHSDNERTTTTSSSDIDLTEYAKLTDLNKYVLKNNSGDTYITTSGNFIVRRDSSNTPLYLAYIATPGDDAKHFAANVDYVQKYFAKTKITGDQLPSVAVRIDQNTVFDNKYVGGLNYATDGTGLETYRNQTKYAAPVGFVKEYVAEQIGNIDIPGVSNIDPSTIIFEDGLKTTYEIGKVRLTNGIGTLVEPGGSLKDFFNIFVDEKNPTTTQPSVSLTFSQAKSYEVGTTINPSYSASLSAGSYSYGPATGITATSWSVKGYTDDTEKDSSTTSSGTFDSFVVGDIDGNGISKYYIIATATYGDGSIPVTNLGNEYSAGQIKAGSKSKTSGSVTCYRNSFYGTVENKNSLSSSVIRGLTSSGKALTNGSSFSVNVPVNALRVVIAYPATLRDLTSVKDVNGMNAEIISGFTSQIISIEGANNYQSIEYKVYTMDFASANDTANTFTVTI